MKKVILTLQFLSFLMFALQTNAQYFSEPERALINRIGKKSFDTFNVQTENSFEPQSNENVVKGSSAFLAKLVSPFDFDINKNRFKNNFEELFDQISKMNKLKARLDDLIWKDLIISLKAINK